MSSAVQNTSCQIQYVSPHCVQGLVFRGKMVSIAPVQPKLKTPHQTLHQPISCMGAFLGSLAVGGVGQGIYLTIAIFSFAVMIATILLYDGLSTYLAQNMEGRILLENQKYYESQLSLFLPNFGTST